MLSKTNFAKLFIIIILLSFVSFFSFCKTATIQLQATEKVSDVRNKDWSNEPIQPIPTEIKVDSRKVDLGEKLFNDARLSANDTISCATCHVLTLGGTDRMVNSVGINGKVGVINSPTVFNSSFNFKQFWDGRAETLQEQIEGPIHTDFEMGADWNQIIQKLSDVPEYVSEFSGIYKDGIQSTNIKDAIATFEKTLITPDSRFDLFLKGQQDAISVDEKEGYRLFKAVGCVSCHQGINIGGNLFQEFGVMGNYFKKRGNLTTADLGRYNVTKEESDKHVFKVPSLRNIELTAPYFHDGSAKNLEDVVSVMSRFQLGRKLSPEETASLVKFLKTLNGNYTRYSPK